MACSRVIMARWGRKVKQIYTDSGIDCLMLSYYVDDVREVISMLSNGTRWIHEVMKLITKPEWKTENFDRNAKIEHTKNETLK